MSKYVIFCDGCCLNNGKPDAVAGFGVVVYEGTVQVATIKEKLRAEEPQTNQRAELQALNYALDICATVQEHRGAQDVTIMSDSEYAIKCVTEWGSKWTAKDKKAHKDLIKAMIVKYDKLAGAEGAGEGRKLKLVHVAGHQSSTSFEAVGNKAADKLANAACAES